MSDLLKVGPDLKSTLVYSDQYLTNGLWRDFDRERAMADPEYGSFRLERWHGSAGTTISGATATQATTGTATIIAGPVNFGPLLAIDSDSVTISQGEQVQFPGQGVRGTAGMEILFETMLRAKDIATGMQFFAGLRNVDTTIIASAAVTTGYGIGFSSVTTDKIVKFGMGTNATPTMSTGTAHTLVDGDVTTTGAEWCNLGLRWLVGQSVEAWVQRVKFGHDCLIATEPVGAMIVPSYAAQVAITSGGTDAIMEVAWHAIGWKNNATG